MMRPKLVQARLFLALAALCICGAMPCAAYYHFVHYLKSGRSVEKFDLRALPSKTVTFLVSENDPTVYSPTDTLNSVVAQIQQAAAIWNGVATSDLRVAFGGFENTATLQNAPGADVLFEDLPPGVEGFGGPTSETVPVTAADGSQFFPILRSAIHLNRNLTIAPGPSYGPGFLLTTVHEMGHALGLQHTFTSAAMSQSTTRATSVQRPIDTDDIAAISVLYPNQAFAGLGSISGQITTRQNAPVHLASVVAIRAGFGAISAVTNPDGAYRMDGVPPGQYAVYVHTMPPDANILGPWNADGSNAPMSGPVNTFFYNSTSGPTTDLGSATPVSVAAGAVTSGISIQTTGRAAVPFYDGQVYSFFGSNAVMPAAANIQSPSLVTLVASVVGLGSNGQAPGLGVEISGGGASVRSNGIRPYQANGYTYVALDLSFSSGAQPGPQHAVFSTPDYTYVLPSALYLTQALPPAITSVTANGDGTATINGANFAGGTQFYFDSLASAVSSLDTINGAAVVTPPPGASGQQATITAYSPDGQNSAFVQSSPVTFSYPSPPAPAIAAITPASLPAGSEAVIDIAGSGFSFSSPSVPPALGFGTSDILVRRIFALSANHIQADVSIAPGAALSTSDVAVTSGFVSATAPSGFQITAPVAGAVEPIPVLTNAVPGLNGAYPGATVNLSGRNLSVNANVAPAVSIGGAPVQVVAWSPTLITLQLPLTFVPGPAVLFVNNGYLTSLQTLVNIDPVPAGFAGVQLASGVYVDNQQAAHIGNTLIATMVNFAPAGSTTALSRVQVGLGGVLIAPSAVTQVGAYTQVSFVIAPGDPVGPAEQLVVYLDGRSSLPASIQVQP